MYVPEWFGSLLEEGDQLTLQLVITRSLGEIGATSSVSLTDGDGDLLALHVGYPLPGLDETLCRAVVPWDRIAPCLPDSRQQRLFPMSDPSY